MVVKNRQKGARNWARGIFAFMWIALGGLSSLYLLTLFTDPSALGANTGGLARGVSIPSGTGPLSTAQVTRLKGSLASLSEQITAINTRLDSVKIPEEPAERASPQASQDTSPPKPEPLAEAEPAQVPVEVVAEETESDETVAAPVRIAAADTTPVREPEPLPVREPEPKPEPQLVMPDPNPVVETPPPAVVDPPSAVVDPPSVVVDPPSVVTAPMLPEAETVVEAAPVAPAEIAALDPAILPRTANDGSTRYGIELGTVSKREGLRPLWRELLTKHAALVAGLQPRRVLAPDRKWRLIAGPFANAQDAEGACSLFKKAGRKCAATVYAGDSL